MASFTSTPDAKKSAKKRNSCIPIGSSVSKMKKIDSVNEDNKFVSPSPSVLLNPSSTPKPLDTPKKRSQKKNKGGDTNFETLLLDWEEEVTTDEIVKSSPEKGSVARKNIDDSLTIKNKSVDRPSKQNNSTLSLSCNQNKILEKSCSYLEGTKDAASLKLSPTKVPLGTEKSETPSPLMFINLMPSTSGLCTEHDTLESAHNLSVGSNNSNKNCTTNKDIAENLSETDQIKFTKEPTSSQLTRSLKIGQSRVHVEEHKLISDNDNFSIAYGTPEAERIKEDVQEEPTIIKEINITTLLPSSLSNATANNEIINETISDSPLNKSAEDESVKKISLNVKNLELEAKDSGDKTANISLLNKPFHLIKNKKVTDVSEIPLPKDIDSRKTDVKKEEINPKLKDKCYDPLVFDQSLNVNPKPAVRTSKKVDMEIFCGKNAKPPKELIANASQIITLNFVKAGEELRTTPGNIHLFNVVVSSTPPPGFVPARPDQTIIDLMEARNQPSTSKSPVASVEKPSTPKIPSRKVKASKIKCDTQDTEMANISIPEKQPTSSKQKVKILSPNSREKRTPTAGPSKAPEKN